MKTKNNNKKKQKKNCGKMAVAPFFCVFPNFSQVILDT